MVELYSKVLPRYYTLNYLPIIGHYEILFMHHPVRFLARLGNWKGYSVHSIGVRRDVRPRHGFKAINNYGAPDIPRPNLPRGRPHYWGRGEHLPRCYNTRTIQTAPRARHNPGTTRGALRESGDCQTTRGGLRAERYHRTGGALSASASSPQLRSSICRPM